MATIKQNSLLGIPAELRMRIYRHLFQETCVSVRMYNFWHYEADEDGHEDDDVYECKSEPLLAGETTTDNGITLTSRLLRTESIPLLRRSLKVYCEIDSGCDGQAPLCIKAEYRKLIREARFIFNSQSFGIPWLDLPSLETASFECDEDFEPLQPPALDSVPKWAFTGDIHQYVASIKSQISGGFRRSLLSAALQNKARAFKIRWRDCVSSMNPYDIHHVDGGNFWLEFDWDSLEVFEGSSDLQQHYLKIIEKEGGTDSEHKA